MSRLSRVLFPDDYTVFEVGCNPGLSNKRTRVCPSNDDVVTMSVLEQTTSCLAQLAGPDVPEVMIQKSSKNTRREKRKERKDKPKRKALRTIDRNISNRNVDERTNDAVTKPQNNRPRRKAAKSINKPRRVTAESMDILGQIGNLEVDGFSCLVTNEHDNDKQMPRTRRTRSTNDKENSDLVFTSLVPVQCSSPIAPPPKKQKETKKLKETKKTPEQLCGEKNKKDDSLENIIWNSLSSTIRKKRKREQKISKKSNDSTDTPNTNANECNSESSSQQVTPCSDLRDDKVLISSSPLEVTEKVNEHEIHRTSETSNDDQRRKSKRKSQKILPLTNNNSNDNTSKSNVSTKLPIKKRKLPIKAVSLPEKDEQISLRRSSRRRCPTDRLVDHIPLEYENSCPRTKETSTLKKSSQKENSRESDTSPLTVRKSTRKNKSVERPTVNDDNSIKKSVEECRDKWFSQVKTPTLRHKKPSKQQNKLKTQQRSSDDDDDIFNATPIKDGDKNNLEDSSENESEIDASTVAVRKSSRRKRSVKRLTVNHNEKNNANPSDSSLKTKANVAQHKTRGNKKRKESQDITKEEDLSTIDDQSSSDHWDETSLKQLLKAHKETDPKCYFFWHQIASKVRFKSAEECRDKWFSLVKTPTLRRKNPSKQQNNTLAQQQQRSNDDDDIFNATPIRDTAKLLLSWHKTSSAQSRRRSRRSSISFSDILSSPVLKNNSSSVYNKVVDKEIPSPLQFRKMTKCYVKKARAGLADTKSKSQIMMMKKSYNIGGSKKRRKLLSAEIDAGDVHMDGFLSPNGTLTIKAPEEHEVGELYFPSDDENEEYEDLV